MARWEDGTRQTGGTGSGGVALDYASSVSDEERRDGALRPDTLERIATCFDERGFVVVRGLFSAPRVEALHRAYLAQYGSTDAAGMAAEASRGGPSWLVEVGHLRYEIVVRMIDAFREPGVYASDMLLAIISRLLPGDYLLSGVSVVVSQPGAERQHIHRDYGYLFPDGRLSGFLPTYAINVSVPLIDVDGRSGPTGIWPGSHRWLGDRQPMPDDVVAPETRKGDCLLLDYRTLHAGMPNGAELVRPILYMVYARPWFFDESNHRQRASLDMPLDPGEALSPIQEKLLARVLAQRDRERLAQTKRKPGRDDD
jgi:ectoine hydroxylase-related dioxygenase (phytanoyl-CoA dioxygenase family)